MRIATWNMGYWEHRATHEEAWRWLFDSVKPDIAMVQECVPPPWVAEAGFLQWDRAYPDGRQDWGTALFSRFPAKPTTIAEVDDWLKRVPSKAADGEGLAQIHRLTGWAASASIEIPGPGSALVMSLHNPSKEFERERLAGIDISPMKLKLNDDLWLLDVISYSLKDHLQQPLLLGGDFNYSRLLDEKYGPRGNNEFFDRIASEGFVSLHRKFHDADRQTFFKKGRGPYQLDYLYGDATVAARTSRCEVLPHEPIAHLSDHAPLVADLSP